MTNQLIVTSFFQEIVSGAKADRPELAKLRAQLRKGDTVCIYKLDRLGRSMKHLLELIDEFQQKGVGLLSLTDAIDSSKVTLYKYLRHRGVEIHSKREAGI